MFPTLVLSTGSQLKELLLAVCTGSSQSPSRWQTCQHVVSHCQRHFAFRPPDTLILCINSFGLFVQVDPAGFEISGHLILKRSKDYEDVTQECVWRLLSFASLSEQEFDGFVQLALGLD